MKLGDGVEWALHCCTLLGALPPDQAVPSAVLAEFHGVPSAYLAKQMQALARADVVQSVPGRNGGYKLARAATEITLLDVVMAVDGPERAFRCSEVRQNSPGAGAPSTFAKPCGIASAMWRAEALWRAELDDTTIADLVAQLDTEVDAEQAESALIWLIERLSPPAADAGKET